MPIDSAEGGGKQAKLLYMSSPSVMTKSPTSNTCVDKLGGIITINTPASMHTQYKGTYRFEKNLSRMTKRKRETQDSYGERYERCQGIGAIEDEKADEHEKGSTPNRTAQFRKNGASALYTCDKSFSFLIYPSGGLSVTSLLPSLSSASYTACHQYGSIYRHETKAKGSR